MRVAPGTLVNPAHAQVEPHSLALPGGWRVAGRLPEGPAAEEREEDPVLPGGVRASEVLYVGGGKPGRWITDRGPVPASGDRWGESLARLHPRLLTLHADLHVNPLRLRALRRWKRLCLLDFDEGSTLEIHFYAARRLAKLLGTASYDQVGGETEGQRHLRLLGIRRWPLALARAPGDFLAGEFGDRPARLLANLALQTVEAHARGERVPDDHRAWYYHEGRGPLQRAGYLLVRHWDEEAELPFPAEVHWTGPGGQKLRPKEYPTFGFRLPLDKESAWALTCAVWAWVVGRARLCTYRQAGFRAKKTESRRLGSSHPGIVVLVEKEGLAERAMALHERFGVTVYVTGGMPTLIGTENLVEELRARGVAEVWIISYCDFDAWGWVMPTALAEQVDRYGMPVRAVRRLVTPDRFTAKELAELSYPIKTPRTRVHRAHLERFLRESGGIGGEARGIGADHLFPVERVEDAFEAVAGEWLPQAPTPWPTPREGARGPLAPSQAD